MRRWNSVTTDEMDKTSFARLCCGDLARATPWRRSERRPQVSVRPPLHGPADLDRPRAFFGPCLPLGDELFVGPFGVPGDLHFLVSKHLDVVSMGRAKMIGVVCRKGRKTTLVT
jgi:hypothetical protein